MKKAILMFCLLLMGSGYISGQSDLQKFFWSKRYKAALQERDELCSANRQLKADTAQLHSHLKRGEQTFDSLSTAHKELESTYTSLVNSSGKKLAELNLSLDNKSKELAKKEKNLVEKDKQLRELQALIQKQDSILNRLNATVKNALLGFNADEFGVEMKNGKVYVSLSDKLLFKSGNASVEEKGKDAIKKLAEVLNKNPDIDVAIEGHTDNIPIKTAVYKDNWDLSVARSTNIVRMICDDFKVEPKHVTAAGKGEYFPVASNETSEGRAKNRRTEIVLSPKLEELFTLLKTDKRDK